MSKVFVLDAEKRPLNPINPIRARKLLSSQKASVYRRYPFTIILKESHPDSIVSPLRLKIDPGAKTTGIALVNDSTGEVVFAAELQHRGFKIKDDLEKRRAIRNGRRGRKTRYRKPRFLNRTRPKGWLPPSLQSRVENIKTWVNKILKFAPIGAISQELKKFDTQLIRNPDIQGKEYQQGTLAGYEVREYLLEKWHRTCAYCGAKNVQMQIDHIHPKSKGGTDSITNLVLACEKCNIKKGTQDVRDFLKSKEKADKILVQARFPLREEAALNATRYAILNFLQSTGIPVEVSTGSRTKMNRIRQDLPRSPWTDAACIGESTPKALNIEHIKPLIIVANGWGTRKICQTNRSGFPTKHRGRTPSRLGIQTGDICTGLGTGAKKGMSFTGRVTIRRKGKFTIKDKNYEKVVDGIAPESCKVLHRKDGYSCL